MMSRSVVAVALLFALTACGGGGSASGGDEFQESVDAMGKCSAVWIDGKTLPEKYEGCIREDGDIEAGASFECEDGSSIYTYEPDSSGFYTEASGKIVEAGEDYANDPGYAALMDAC